MNQTHENITRATQCAPFVTDALRDALKTAGAVQGMAILALIERSAALSRDIAALERAVAHDAA